MAEERSWREALGETTALADEFNRFQTWVARQFGIGEAGRFNSRNFRDSRLYDYWISLNKPEHAQSNVAPRAAEQARRAAEEARRAGEATGITPGTSALFDYRNAVAAAQAMGLPVPDKTEFLRSSLGEEGLAEFRGTTPGEPAPETPTAETPFKPEPIPGYVWAPVYGPDGEILTWETKPDPGWRSPAEEAQLEMQREAMAWEREKTRQNLMAERWNAMAERIGAWSRPDLERVRQEERAKVWDTIKAEIMGGLEEPRDWIKRWELQNTRNPYRREETTAYDEMKQAQAEVKKHAAALFQDIDRPDATYSREDKELRNFHLTALKNAGEAAEHWTAKAAEERAEYEKTLGPGQFTPPSPEPTTPPTPGWLANLYPDMPSRIEKREGMPLSAQAMGRMTTSELQGWKGYAEWAGYSPEDLLTQTAQMMPLGGTSRTWQPPSQRAI